ncbi:hypothetical protein CLV78_102602 [Aliiruegeria haliotis]|uniref:Glycosyl transferase family 2 n=1 Tax=Aliiruegeria haliotis TaxID=1280846 RepID=A0A2T0RWJ3_9RHOB|nr:hypothetical protein [Aliiruegeria haliotis]PRY25423.1 hypothetical protein CLV78_102602 [Aliiruegeria haliotis]
MHYPDIDSFVKAGKAVLDRGPIAAIFVEDDIEIASTVEHHVKCGFQTLVLLTAPTVELPGDLPDFVHSLPNDPHRDEAICDPLNRIVAAAPAGTWMYYGYNAEYLFYPFCEDRTVGEMLAFHAEERRDAMVTFVVDLYADDLDTYPNAVACDRAHLDRAGYFALSRNGEHGPKERQLDFFGGLRWRFEEHVPKDRRKIDRVSLFRTKPGLRLRPDFTFNDEEYNTFSCPWHHNLTAAVCSFRTAKALKLNPGSSPEIRSFGWFNSTPFEWSSQQLMDLGLMEPGQWF